MDFQIQHINYGPAKPYQVMEEGQEEPYIKYPLDKGFYMLIDIEDLEFAEKYAWYAKKGFADKYYVCRTTEYINGKQKTVRFHRELLGITEKSVQVDHKFGDTLDNRKSKLRLCNGAQNAQNRRKFEGSTSVYLGVNWSKMHKKWRANFTLNKKSKFIGLFDNEEDAARAYDKKAIEHYGEFANPNFKY